MSSLLKEMSLDPRCLALPEAKRFSPQSVYVRMQNVADWFYDGTDQEFWSWQDFPSVAPPFRESWMEFCIPVHSSSKLYGRTENPLSGVRSGCLLHAFERSDPVFAKFRGQEAKSRPTPGGVVEMKDFLIEAAQRTHWRWLLAGDLWLGGEKATGVGSPLCYGSVCAMVAPDGRLTAFDEVQGYMTMTPGSWSSGMEISDSEFKRVGEDLVRLSLPFWMTLSMMNCKNVLLVDAAGKGGRRGYKDGYKGVRWKELEIEPLRRAVRSASGSGQLSRASLHLVRGHFKDYRESGLFGKHKGVYWWDQLARGDAAVGEARKTYNVRGPA